MSVHIGQNFNSNFKSGDTKKTRVIAVTSGKGGVGKTNICTNLALIFVAMGKNVVLFDGDLGLSNVNILLKVIPQYNLIDVMRKYRRIDEILTDSGYGFQFLSGIPGFSGLANITPATVDYFFKEMLYLSFAHILLVDTSAGIGKSVVSFLAAANDIVIVTTPEPTAMADAYGMMKVLSSDLDSSNVNLHLLVNKVASHQQGKEVAYRIVQASESILRLKVSYLGCISDDITINKAVMNQVPFVAFKPKTKASIELQNIAQSLINQDNHGGGKGLKLFFKAITK